MLRDGRDVGEALVDGRLHRCRGRLVALGLLVTNMAPLRRWERRIVRPSCAVAAVEVDPRPLPLLVVLELHETMHELEVLVIIVLTKQRGRVGQHVLHRLAALFPPLNLLKVAVKLVAFG